MSYMYELCLPSVISLFEWECGVGHFDALRNGEGTVARPHTYTPFVPCAVQSVL